MKWESCEVHLVSFLTDFPQSVHILHVSSPLVHLLLLPARIVLPVDQLSERDIRYLDDWFCSRFPFLEDTATYGLHALGHEGISSQVGVNRAWVHWHRLDVLDLVLSDQILNSNCEEHIEEFGGEVLLHGGKVLRLTAQILERLGIGEVVDTGTHIDDDGVIGFAEQTKEQIGQIEGPKMVNSESHLDAQLAKSLFLLH